jgi:hypothetical protein
VVQSVARVLRSKNPSAHPIVVDILDRTSIWRNAWYQRRRFYTKEGFNFIYQNILKKDEKAEDETKEENDDSIDYTGEIEEETGEKFKKRSKLKRKSNDGKIKEEKIKDEKLADDEARSFKKLKTDNSKKRKCPFV